MNTPVSDRKPDHLIVIRDLCYKYPSTAEWALSNIDLEIKRGQCFGLLGPNGAGKTTLLSILTGITAHQTGLVTIAGHALSRAGEIKKLSAIVPQDFAFYPGLTGLENLRFFAGLYGLRGPSREQGITTAVDICQLSDVLDKAAETYSGGIKRRLNLAIGLLNQPDILYLDEPTVGIDAQSRKFILEAIKTLKSRGTTIVYTSHYMEEVQAICDELAIIDHGKLVLQSSMAALLDDQDQVLDVTLRDAPSQQQVAQLTSLGRCEIDGRRLRLRLDSADIGFESLLQRLKSAGLTPRQIQYGVNRLEDVYLSITKHALRE